MIKKYPHIFISAIASLLLIPFLGSAHLFDWDEINFAEAAREMIVSNNFSRVQINFEPFWEKPPLFFWFQVSCMKLFGINEFAARLPNALCGIVTLNVVFYYGKKIFNSELAWWWILLYVGSFTPHFYFKSGIIDPFFNLFIFLAIVQLYLGSTGHSKHIKYFVLCGFFLGLALLTKGPVAILITGLCGLVFLIISRFKPWFNFTQLLILCCTALLIPLLWFVPDWIHHGFWFTKEFLNYQVDLFLYPVASHGQPWFYHPVVLLIGCFPAAIIALPYIFKNRIENTGTASTLSQLTFITFMKIMFWVVLILFSMVTTKIVHYSSLCYLPLTFLAALGLHSSQAALRLWQKILIGLIGFVYAILFIILPLLVTNAYIKDKFFEVLKDDFVKENLLVETNWFGWEWIFGIIFLGLLIFSFVIYQSNSKGRGLRIMLIGNALFIFFISVFMVPKIENHVQGSIISFYEQLKNKDVYIETVGFKSYAHYYYIKKRKPLATDQLTIEIKKFQHQNGIDKFGQLNDIERKELFGFEKQWYLTGNIDKPVYLVYKINRTEEIDTNRNFKLVMDRGGFKVFKREVDKK